MKFSLLLGVAGLALATAPAYAQNTLEGTSNSDANAVSGSASGASSDNTNTNGQAQQANNAGIGNSASDSNSFSGAVSGSESSSNGNQQGQDQGQSQGQSANNSQGQSSSNTNSLGQQASNQQGVSLNQTWNSHQRKVTEFRTNAAVPLAASSSFSSDYCGGTASGGVSAAPLGISIGGAGPTFDKSCQSLRRAEKFGMAAANWHNLGYDDRAVAMMRMMEWSICTSDSKGAHPDTTIAEACDHVLSMAGSPPNAPTPLRSESHEVTPEYTTPNVQPLPDQYKTPRGDLEFKSSPVIQGESALQAAAR